MYILFKCCPYPGIIWGIFHTVWAKMFVCHFGTWRPSRIGRAGN